MSSCNYSKHAVGNGFPSSHQLKSYVASKSRLKLAARAVLLADAGLLVSSGILPEQNEISLLSKQKVQKVWNVLKDCR